MKGIFVFICVLLAITTQAQFDKQVKQPKISIGKATTLTGNLNEGNFVDLRFGTRASVNCFAEKEKHQFNGKHVFYTFQVPAGTKVLVDLYGKVDMSLYGYLIDAKRYDIPPHLENVSKFGCKSSHAPNKGQERILLAAGTVPMNVIIAVVGANESENGDFTLKITTKK